MKPNTSTRTPAFRLTYLPANNAWTFLLGDTPTALAGFGLFFSTRDSAEYAARTLRLKIDKRGNVSVRTA